MLAIKSLKKKFLHDIDLKNTLVEMNITVAKVTTRLVEFATEKAAQKWIDNQKLIHEESQSGVTVEYQIWSGATNGAL